MLDVYKISGVKIDGIIACLPENLIDNKQSCSELFGDGVETLIKATGISARCVADVGTSSLDLGVTAAKELILKTSTSPDEIGAIICVTFTPEYLMPADAPAAQARLGLPNNLMAFDINMACSGYGYGLYIASLIARSINKKVLLLDGDVQSAYVSKNDKATVPVMSDIGTATLITPDNTAAEWKFSFYTDGKRREALFIPAGGSRHPISHQDLEYKEYEDGSKRRNIDIFMDGFGIFSFVAQNATKFIMGFMEENGLTPIEIDAFVPHQANMYMVGQMAKKLKFNPEKVWKSGDEYGNPASASIPLTIAKNATEWFGKNNGGNLLIAGFGGGLSISVANISLSSKAVYSLIQYKKENIDG